MKKQYPSPLDEARSLKSASSNKHLISHIDTLNSTGLRVTLNYYSDMTYRVDITNSRSTRKLKSLVSSEELVNELQAYGVSNDFIQKAIELNEKKLKEARGQSQEEQ